MLPPRARVLALLLLAGCDDPAATSPAATAAEPGCTPGTWGVPAYDAIFDVRLDGAPLAFELEPERWIERPEAVTLADRLDAATSAEPTLPPRARVVLQNDVWGLWQRVSAVPTSSPIRARLLDASAGLVRRLALDAPPASGATPPSVSGATPPSVAAILSGSEGWRDVEAELPVLSHERLFGLRRLFHVRVRDGERALYSTLVAVDARGALHATDVVGDLEVLRFDGPTVTRGRVFELDRRALRCDGPLASLTEVDRVTRVPGLGADGFLATFDPPALLDAAPDAIPCARCHEDDVAMTLPSDALEPGRRHRALLEQLERAERPR